MTLRLLEQLVARLKAQIEALPSLAETLTNKTIDGEDNTLTNIGIGSLASVVAKASLNGTQAIPNSLYHIINLSTVDYDPQGCITTGAAWKFTAPEAGLYAANIHIRYAAIAAAGTINLELFVNGVRSDRLGSTVASADAVNLGGLGTAQLAAGEYLDFRTSQGSATGDRNLDYATVPVIHALVWRLA